jgi:Fanconi-associated nuclease 1
MLKGRESLIRLIGKRRRFLPNPHSLLSDSIEITLNHCKKENVEPSSIEVGESSFQLSDCNWVTCPVCGDKVRGEDYMINSHLDTCLSRGKKRKLSQRTLLQLNFSAKPKVKVESTELQYTGLSYQIGSEEKNIICCKSPSNPAFITDSTLDYLTENPVKDAEVNYRVVESPIEDNADESLDDISGVVLNSFIVGRKFCEEVDIQTGASIFLTRDPNNPKDVNAVKSGSICRFWM